MRSHQWSLVCFLAYTAVIVVRPTVAFSQAPPDPCSIATNQPGDVSVQLSLKNGQSVFREGEIVALAAEYSSSAAKKYYLNTRNYDRSGRLDGMEVFCIDPDAGRDPLSDYFNGTMGFLGGGLGSEQDIGEKPYVVELELNEWKSLPPGWYRLSIVSYRVSAPSDGNPYGAEAAHPALRSNGVRFQVVKAEPEWQAEQLAAAVHLLDSSDKTGEDAKHAARVLRFLGSEASTRELARRFWSGNDQPFGWDLKFGLYGSPYRATAMQAMNAALMNPQHPVTQELVQTLATLEMQSDPDSRLPQYDEAHKESWTKIRDAYFAAFSEKIAKHMSDVAATLQSKAGQARAVSVSELLQSDVSMNAGTRAQLRQVLLSSWDSLPPRRKTELIEYRWDQIGGPELLPILRSIVAGAPNRSRDMDKSDRASALRRIYEVAPADGRELISREIANPQGDIGIDVLGLLPDRELPQIEQPLIAKMQAGNGADIDFQLIERYGSMRALPEIRAIYDRRRGEWACIPQTALLRYFLRVDSDYGISAVQDALGLRHATGCYKFQFAALDDYIRRPKLEQIAIAALHDPSPEVVRDAAQALSRYGSAKTEASLWARLESFHDHWKDKQDVLHYRPGVEPDLLAEIGLEQVLVQAITNGQSWFITEESVNKLKEMASPQVQTELDGVMLEIQRGEYGLNLNWWPDGALNYSVGRYTGRTMAALKEKLAQFPSGAHLDLVTTTAELERHRAEFVEVENAAAAAGLTLRVQTPR
jgi:hypothetical protein